MGVLQEKTMDFESRIQSLTEENKELAEALENERTLVKILREKVDKSNLMCDESKAEVNHLNSMVTEMQHDFLDIQRKFDKWVIYMVSILGILCGLNIWETSRDTRIKFLNALYNGSRV